MQNFYKQNFFLFLVILLLIGCQNESGGQDDFSDRSLREKIGQLFIVRPEALSSDMTLEQINHTTEYGVTAVSDLMKQNYKKYPVGGFCIFAKNVKSPQQIKQLNQQLSKLGNVIISTDEEGGRVARLGNIDSFHLNKYESPESVALSDNTNDVYSMGQYIGSYLTKYGFNLDFAPVADVNSNPNNIIIGNRSFGSQPNKVAQMVVAFQEGLNSSGIVGCLKHFPGHGDTTGDTHNGYVEILKTWEQLLECEIIPFKAGILAGADMIMTAHIATPNITNNNLPSSLSYTICTEKLREELGFNGVIITDAMSMGAIHNDYSSGYSSVKAILAGCDIILMPYNLQEAFDAVVQAVKDGKISQTRLEESVKRIAALKAKICSKSK